MSAKADIFCYMEPPTDKQLFWHDICFKNE